MCNDNGITHLLTAPRSPTTTGKVERFHRTLRAEFFAPNDRRLATLEEAQSALDAWVAHYNTEPPHEAIGMATPAKRFALAAPRPDATELAAAPAPSSVLSGRPPGVSRWVNQSGKISVAGQGYHVGPVFAGEPVDSEQGRNPTVIDAAITGRHDCRFGAVRLPDVARQWCGATRGVTAVELGRALASAPDSAIETTGTSVIAAVVDGRRTRRGRDAAVPAA